MLSRVANSIYWMSRYLERADNVARFVDVNSRLVLDSLRDRGPRQWEPLVLASGDDADFQARYDIADETSVVKFLTFDPDNSNSILSCVGHARENARTIREVISSEMWETINSLYHFVEEHRRKRKIDDLLEFYAQVKRANNMLTGLIENTMSHGESWHFSRMGRLLERSDKTARMLDVKYFLLLPNPQYVGTPYDSVEWGAVLASASGFEVYMKRFHRVDYKGVAQFLILDEHFPRSIRSCVRGAAWSLSRIVDMVQTPVSAHGEMAKLEDMLETAQVENLLGAGLHEFVDVFQFNLNVVDQALYKSFFALERA